MPIKRYVASKDSTITNTFKEGLKLRATDANMGASDVLEVFSLYSERSSDYVDYPGISRIVMDFPVDTIIKDREEGNIPQSGSVQFIMKLSNTPHPFTLPENFYITVNPLSKAWTEGRGLDMERYKDKGSVNWLSASNDLAWDMEGGDYHESPSVSQLFEEGTEDLEVDLTEIVESWITGSIEKNGLMIKLSSSHEDDTTSYYTKKFFARGTEFFFKRPTIEARFDATIKDSRSRFYNYNPFVDIEENNNTLYIYNRFKGKLQNLRTVGTGSIYVRLYSSADLPLGDPLMLLNQSYVVTGSWVSKGIYKADIGIDTQHDYVYDIWFDENDDPIGYGGKIEVLNPDQETTFSIDDYVINIKNLKNKYSAKEKARMQVFARLNNWNPNSYTSVVNTPPPGIVEDMYYKIFRIADDLDVIPYGTGSMNHTRLSYDKTGNYFDLDMSLLEPGYSYGIKFSILDLDNIYENKSLFKFKVE